MKYHNRKSFYILFLALLILSIDLNAHAQSSGSINASKYFKGHDGCFVIYNLTSHQYRRYNAKRCGKRFLPASTFKIPNSLIGLETGVIPDENYVIRWDSVSRPIKEWNRDHSLASAIQYSVVPYYQELARRVGREKMQAYLDTMQYGSMKIGKSVDMFWLDNSLEISADEQVEFLRKFFDGKLPFSKRSIEIVKKILPEERHPKSNLKSKTGTGEMKNGYYIGWLVGYVEHGPDTHLFAMNVEAKTFDEVKNLRKEIADNVLTSLNILD